MTESKRIILNTLASYGKSIVTLPLNLLSARWVLKGLGADDFGLYGIVGGVVFFITFINAVTAQALSRFYAFGIGSEQKDRVDGKIGSDEVSRWFNTAVSVCCIVPILLCVIGYPIGIYAIKHWLVVPPGRLVAAIWVFRISLITASLSAMFMPYKSLYSAHQFIIELTCFNMLTSICAATFAYCFSMFKGDRLIIYAIGMVGVNVGISFLQVVRAYWQFKSARIKLCYMFEWNRLREILSFTWWRIVASAGLIAQGQGCSFLVNLNFGVAANAACSVANQLSAQSAAFSAHLSAALQPAIATAAGFTNDKKAVKLSLRSCKFTTLLVMLFGIPLALEIDEVIHLWLENPPEKAGELCVYMIAVFIIGKLTSGHDLALSAYGRVAAWQMSEAIVLASTFFTGWILIRLGMSVEAIGVAYIITVCLNAFVRLYFARRYAQMGVMIWCRSVLMPVLCVLLISLAGGLACRYSFDSGFVRLCCTTFVCSFILISSSWLLAFDDDERKYIIKGVKSHLPF